MIPTFQDPGTLVKAYDQLGQMLELSFVSTISHSFAITYNPFSAALIDFSVGKYLILKPFSQEYAM